MAICRTDRQDVLLARMACGGQILSMVEKIRFFSSMFSITASITRSTSLKSSGLMVPVSRARVASFS